MGLTRLAAIIHFVLFFANSVGAQEGFDIRLDSSMSLHVTRQGETVHVTPDGEDYADMMAQVCTAMKLSIDSGDCLIYPFVTTALKDGPGAVATREEGNNMIIYDRRLSPLVGYQGALGIVAHEVGHHYCGHLGIRPTVRGAGHK